MSIKKDMDYIDTWDEHDVQWGKGDIALYQDMVFHNPHGPAIIYANGDKYWYHLGKLHRTDGPAVMCTSGYIEFWLNGIQYSENEWRQIINQ